MLVGRGVEQQAGGTQEGVLDRGRDGWEEENGAVGDGWCGGDGAGGGDGGVGEGELVREGLELGQVLNIFFDSSIIAACGRVTQQESAHISNRNENRVVSGEWSYQL